MRVSEIRVNQIRVNQGLGVIIFRLTHIRYSGGFCWEKPVRPIWLVLNSNHPFPIRTATRGKTATTVAAAVAVLWLRNHEKVLSNLKSGFKLLSEPFFFLSCFSPYGSLVNLREISES